MVDCGLLIVLTVDAVVNSIRKTQFSNKQSTIHHPQLTIHHPQLTTNLVPVPPQSLLALGSLGRALA
jgi:hypothetical protein